MTDTVVLTKTDEPGTPVPAVPEEPDAPSTPVLVDNPNLPAPGVTDEKRKPILPPWLKDRTEFATAAKHTASRAGYASMYHGLRAPWYAAQLAMMSPRGTCRFVASTNRWLWDREAGPKPGQYAQSLNGYELPIAMEVRRGRYLQSFETPHALTPDAPTEWNIPLRDHDHVFLKGHRIMVQIQSTWFPLIDRNPQKFVPSIYKAIATDFAAATQRIYCSPAMPSHVVLPVMH